MTQSIFPIFPPKVAIQNLTAFVKKHPQQVSFDKNMGGALTNLTSFDHIEYCAQAFLFGALPNEETLYFIASALNKYVCAGGGLTLDKAFGLKSKSKAGNPSKQNARRSALFFKLHTMAQMRAADPKLSIENAAVAVCNDVNSSEAETLTREWKRQNKERDNYFNELVLELRGK